MNCQTQNIQKTKRLDILRQVNLLKVPKLVNHFMLVGDGVPV